MKRKPGTFYVEPIGGLANEAVSKALEQNVIQSEASKKRCADGERRDLWQVPEGIVRQLKTNNVPVNVFETTLHGEIQVVNY